MYPAEYWINLSLRTCSSSICSSLLINTPEAFLTALSNAFSIASSRDLATASPVAKIVSLLSDSFSAVVFCESLMDVQLDKNIKLTDKNVYLVTLLNC